MSFTLENISERLGEPFRSSMLYTYIFHILTIQMSGEKVPTKITELLTLYSTVFTK